MTAYIEAEFAKLNTKNTLKLEYLHGGKAWVADTNHWNFEAARRATEVRSIEIPHAGFDQHAETSQAVYLQTPNYTREGGSIPVTLTIADNLGVNILLLPMGRADDGAQCVTFVWKIIFIRIAETFPARPMRNWISQTLSKA